MDDSFGKGDLSFADFFRDLRNLDSKLYYYKFNHSYTYIQADDVYLIGKKKLLSLEYGSIKRNGEIKGDLELDKIKKDLIVLAKLISEKNKEEKSLRAKARKIVNDVFG